MLAGLAVQLASLGVALPVALIMTDRLISALVIFVAVLLGTAAELRTAVAVVREANEVADYHREVREYHESLKELRALTANGAPDRAYWRAHCGCVHVETWRDDEWTRETMAELNPDCPLVQAYQPVGGQGV